MHLRDYSNIQRLRYNERMPDATNIEGLEILLHIDSFCLGDTLCFSSLLDSFFDFHKPKKMYVTTFWPELFKNTNKYIFLDAVGEGSITIDKLISVGYSKENLSHTLNGMFYAAKDTMKLPQEISYSRPPVRSYGFSRKINKITIGPESTKKIAKWNYFEEYGWQVIVDYLKEKNFEIHNVSHENTLRLTGTINHHENDDIVHAIKHICESRVFIGLSSGLAWLAWSYNVPVVMISGFTKKYNEFNCYRVLNERCCNGCFNVLPNISLKCPLFLGTERENECHKTITPQMVISEVDKALKNFIS